MHHVSTILPSQLTVFVASYSLHVNNNNVTLKFQITTETVKKKIKGCWLLQALVLPYTITNKTLIYFVLVCN